MLGALNLAQAYDTARKQLAIAYNEAGMQKHGARLGVDTIAARLAVQSCECDNKLRVRMNETLFMAELRYFTPLLPEGSGQIAQFSTCTKKRLISS